MQKQEIFNIFILFILSFSVNYYYGSLGVFPIDTFAFFDSANLINKGLLPIRDYWTSNGFLVDILQSFFFKLFGVNWFAYLLHSSLLNFIFAYLTYRFLIFEGLSSRSSLFYSACVAILAYSSAGVPFPDHHSLILSIISIYALIYAFRNKSSIFIFISLLFLILAFLSKQTPAGMFLIMFSIYVVLYSIEIKSFSFIKNSFIFILLLIFSILVLLIINKIGIKNFIIQYLFFPLTIGVERSSNFKFVFILKSFIGEYKFFLLAILTIFYQFVSLKNKKFANLFETKIVFLFVVLIAIINQEIMKNQNIIFFLLPIIFGIIHSQIKLTKKINKTAIVLSIILINTFITLKYHERFNMDRKFMDLQNIDKSNYISGEEISSNLKGLKWVTKANQTNLKDEVNLIKKSIKYLKNNKDNSIIISEYQFINSEIDHNIYSPNRWYTNDGVSYPLSKNIYREYYIDFFKQKLLDKDIKNIFTILPLDQKSFDFIFKSNCIKSISINKILFKHELLNCFER
tara:strand:- start:773 stop:2317 length:1545 start_codon:yes stop_codon:yes gene_type:complete